MAGLGQEVGETSLVELDLARDTTLEELLAGCFVGAVQGGDKLEGLGGENLGGLLGRDLCEDGDSCDFGIKRHLGYRCVEVLKRVVVVVVLYKGERSEE